MQNCKDVVQMLCKCCIFAQPNNSIIMATVAIVFRTAKKTGFVNLRFRLSDGRNVQLYHKSDIVVDIAKWDVAREKIKSRAIISDKERADIDKRVSERKNLLNEVYNSHKGEEMNNETFERLIDEALHPDRYRNKDKGFFEVFDEYMAKHEKAETTKKNFMVLYRCLQRFEAVYAIEAKLPKFKLTFDKLDEDILRDFEDFLRNEHTLYEEYPQVYERFKYSSDNRKNPKPKERGLNAVCTLIKKFRTFISWCNTEGITDNYPFKRYKIKAERYGRPVYISLEERNMIADYDLSHDPRLETQRDIFIFQCLIGCRVSDLLRLTRDNIVNGAVEYVAQKTKDEKAEFVRVPLNGRASAILKKYRKHKGTGLLPFITSQRYNDAIKEVFTACGITRMVTVINPTTGEEEKRPINEVASSHMARRTFVGNIYKQVKDPNLIGALSGHKEGSRAFARYRDIDEDIKKEVVSLIN